MRPYNPIADNRTAVAAKAMANCARTRSSAIERLVIVAIGGSTLPNRNMRGPRVLYRADGRTFAEYVVKDLLARVARKAGIQNNGPHILRHTFISHLAMRGAPARAIQELAGHKDLATTQRYMHLSPSAIENAIRLLEEPSPLVQRGDILETEVNEIGN
jgi:integrase